MEIPRACSEDYKQKVAFVIDGPRASCKVLGDFLATSHRSQV